MAKLIEAALDTQNVIAWRDILYEGPVFNKELEELRVVPGKFPYGGLLGKSNMLVIRSDTKEIIIGRSKMNKDIEFLGKMMKYYIYIA